MQTVTSVLVITTFPDHHESSAACCAHLILFCMAKSFLSSSVVSGQNTLLYRRVIMYFSTWSITCSTDSEEPGDQSFTR